MKGQDILVMLKLVARGRDVPWTYMELARELDMSASEVHAAVRRCTAAGLYNEQCQWPQLKPLQEFLVYGLRYVFPAQPGAITNGLPTSFAAPPLRNRLRFSMREAPVMPLSQGRARGPHIVPLYRSAPLAASRDAKLYELLALVDALRVGRTREREMAMNVLEERLLV